MDFGKIGFQRQRAAIVRKRGVGIATCEGDATHGIYRQIIVGAKGGRTFNRGRRLVDFALIEQDLAKMQIELVVCGLDRQGAAQQIGSLIRRPRV